MTNYSVLMSVYKKENPNYLRESLNSVFNQTIKSNDVCLICDGALTSELDQVIEEFKNKYRELSVYKIDESVGLGKALNYGINKCKNEYIMRMDSDDFSLPQRAEKQINILNSGFDITSSYVGEFNNDIWKIDSIRKIPIDNKHIWKYLKFRCPFNHPATMFKKKCVLNAGNYSSRKFDQDYDLWIRMFSFGCFAKNDTDILVHMRKGNGMIGRRFNKESYDSRKDIRKMLKKYKIINFFEYLLIRFFEWLIFASPMFIKKFLYRFILRKKNG